MAEPALSVLGAPAPDEASALSAPALNAGESRVEALSRTPAELASGLSAAAGGGSKALSPDSARSPRALHLPASGPWVPPLKRLDMRGTKKAPATASQRDSAMASQRDSTVTSPQSSARLGAGAGTDSDLAIPMQYAMKSLRSARQALHGRVDASNARSVVQTALNSRDITLLRHTVVMLTLSTAMYGFSVVLTALSAWTFYESEKFERVSQSQSALSIMFGAIVLGRLLLLLWGMQTYRLQIRDFLHEQSHGVQLSQERQRVYARSGARGSMLELQIRSCDRRLVRLRYCIASSLLSDLPLAFMALYIIMATDVYFNANFGACMVVPEATQVQCASAGALLAAAQMLSSFMAFIYKVRDFPKYVPLRLKREQHALQLEREIGSFSALESLLPETTSTQEISAAVAMRKVLLETSYLAALCKGLTEKALDMWSLRVLRAHKHDSLEAVMAMGRWLRLRAAFDMALAREGLMRGIIGWEEVPGIGALTSMLAISDAELADGRLLVKVSPIRADLTAAAVAANAAAAEEVSAATLTYLLEWLLCVADALSERGQRMVSVVAIDFCGFPPAGEYELKLAPRALEALHEACKCFPLRAELQVQGCAPLAEALRELLPDCSVAELPERSEEHALPQPTTVPAKIGRLGNELDFFSDVSQAHSELVALVLGFVDALEARILHAYSRNNPPEQGKAPLKAFVEAAVQARKTWLVVYEKVEALGEIRDGDEDKCLAVECSLLLSQILLKVGRLAHLPVEVTGAVQVLRVAQGGCTSSTLQTAIAFLRTVHRRSFSSRIARMNRAIKEGNPSMLSRHTREHGDIAWPPPLTNKESKSIYSSMTRQMSRTVISSRRTKVIFKASAKVSPAEDEEGGETVLMLDGKACDDATEARQRFSRLAVDVGMRPLLTLVQKAPHAHVSALLFDECAVQQQVPAKQQQEQQHRSAADAEEASSLVEFWRDDDRVELALEWLFEYYAVVLDALSLRHGRVCYVQPLWRLDGSNPELQTLVLGALQKMNGASYPLMLRRIPIIVLCESATAREHKCALKLRAPIIIIADGEGAARTLAAAGFEANTLPKSLGGAGPPLPLVLQALGSQPKLSALLEDNAQFPVLAHTRSARAHTEGRLGKVLTILPPVKDADSKPESS
jgi:hypothetical protein